METEKLRTHIENIIENTFKTIDEVYMVNQEKKCANGNTCGTFCSNASRLVFPKYRGKDAIRVSEQELRFLFIEQFNKYCTDNKLDLYYSIETPTEEKYAFSSTPKKWCRGDEEDGESANFDMVIFNESKERKCLIEFKNNSSSDAGEHEKDFLKLTVEGADKLCYFISIAESSDSGTLGKKQDAKTGIIPKFKRFADNDEICYKNITYICHCINNRGKKEKKGFDTIYAGIVKGDFRWVEESKIYDK